MERFSRKTAASCRKAAAFVASLMGTYYHNIDAKGRMNFPTKLREILGTTFYVTKGLDQPCLTVCSAAEWERLAAKVAAIPESKGGQLRRWLFSGAGVLTPDKQGRDSAGSAAVRRTGKRCCGHWCQYQGRDLGSGSVGSTERRMGSQRNAANVRRNRILGEAYGFCTYSRAAA